MLKQESRRIIVRMKEGSAIENALPASPAGFGESPYKCTRLYDQEGTPTEILQDVSSRSASTWSTADDSSYTQLSHEEKCLHRTFSVEAPEGADLDALMTNMDANDEVEFTQIDELNQIFLTPNDPEIRRLWGIQKIQCETAWDSTQGEDIVVAVLDTGVDYNHPDIRANMWTNANGKFGFDFSDNDDNPMDYHGHGSHVAGTIAAVGNNRLGVIGVAPKVKIMAIKIFPRAFDSTIARALRWAVDNGAKILNNSWGPSGRRPSNPLIEDAINYVNSKGGTCVFAAGNSNDDVQFYAPANLDSVITVGATDNQDRRAGFSNWGDAVNVSAPGVDILSLRFKTSNYVSMNGTSMACPHVAGLAALYLKQNPMASRQSIQKAIEDACDRIRTDRLLGKGRINAARTAFNSIVSLHLCGTNSQGRLWHSIRWANGSWTRFGDIEGQAGNRGAFREVACSRIGQELHVCGTTSTGRLWHSIRFADGSWQHFGDVEGQTGDRGAFVQVACSGNTEGLHVCGITSNGRLWHTIRRANGSWFPFGDVEGQTGDRGAFNSVACALIGRELHVAGTTTNGRLWHTIRRANGSWFPFGDVEGQTGDRGRFNSVACTDVNGELHLSGTTTTGRLWHTIRRRNGSWQAFGDVEGQTGDRGAFRKVACMGSNGELHLSGTTTDGRLWHTIRRRNGSWFPFGDVEGQTGDRGAFTSVSCG